MVLVKSKEGSTGTSNANYWLRLVRLDISSDNQGQDDNWFLLPNRSEGQTTNRVLLLARSSTQAWVIALTDKNNIYRLSFLPFSNDWKMLEPESNSSTPNFDEKSIITAVQTNTPIADVLVVDENGSLWLGRDFSVKNNLTIKWNKINLNINPDLKPKVSSTLAQY